MLGLASSAQTAIDRSITDRMVLGSRAVVAWRSVVALVVLALLLGMTLVPRLAEKRSSGGIAASRKPASGEGLASLPLTAQSQISGALGADDHAYQVSASQGGFQAASPAQSLRARFTRSGILVDSGEARLGLSLRAVGYGGSLVALGDVAPRANANRVTYTRAGLTEWYTNGPFGLEQGFNIPRALAGRPTGPLTLAMALSGDTNVSLIDGRQALALSHAGTSLSYGGLVARDAKGRLLHSWLAVRGGQVLLRIDTRNADYPLRIDPLIQLGKEITGSGESGNARFGYSVALSSNGKTALIGGPFDNSEAGAVWVFTRSGSTWTQQGEKLTGGEETGAGLFGVHVALSANGNTALIGGSGDDGGIGAAWVFTRSEKKWTQQGAKITGPGETGKGDFGESVALSADGNTALIGAPSDNGSEESLGAAWVFARSEGIWSDQSGKLRVTSEESKDASFGWSVALSADGNTALIGARWNGTPYYEHHGAAWVFTRSGSSWAQQGGKITPSDGEGTENEFGFSVALSENGNTALIGAPDDTNKYVGYYGAAWVFTRSGSTWTQQGDKFAPYGEQGEGKFGWSVALSADGNTALVGGWADTVKEATSGAAWVFKRVGTEWLEEGGKYTATEEKSGSFGFGVALSSAGNVALIGDAQTNGLVGGAYSFINTFSPEELYGMENEAEPDLNRSCAGDPVNCATGNMVEAETDLSVGGRGPGLNVVRTYNSQMAATQSEHGVFGYGWTGPYDAHLTFNEEAETVTVHQDNGSEVVYAAQEGGTYLGAGPWVEATLVKEGSIFIYTLPDQMKLEFNSAGVLTSEVDRNGNAITMSHNSEGQLETVTDGAGRKLTFAYNGEGLVESVKDPMGHTVKYTYESGNLMSVTQPGETALRWQFRYNSEHEMTSEKDGREHAVTTEYGGANRVISQTDAMERTRKWAYSATEAGELQTTITEPNGAVTVEIFNNAYLPTSITHAYGTSIAATTTYRYNANNELVAVTDPNKHTTEYEYDSIGDRDLAIDPNGDETEWSYYEEHYLASMRTPKGETTTYVLESHGNPEAIERSAPGGKIQKTTYKYDGKGDLTSETNPVEHTRMFEYDTYGDRESETDPEGNKRTWKYNEDSQEIASVSARGNVKGGEPSKFETKIERNAKGQPLTVTNALGQTTKYTYDADGDLEALTDGNGHTTTYTYNADNEQTRVEAPNKTVTETEYDADGNVIDQTDGNKHTTKYVRNLLEEVTESVNPLGETTKMEYDAAGNLKTLSDPAKRTTTYAYDSGNRLTEISYSSGTPHSVKYEYDKDGDRIKMVDGTGTTKYTYDVLDRLTETENGNKEKVKYEYNLANEPTKITYPNAKAVERAYDKDGRLEKVTDWNKKETKLSYDPDSDLITTTFPSETKDEDKYVYNDADQLSEIDMKKGTETLASLVYTRDSDGQVKKTVAKGLPGEETTEDAYDENSRLTKAGSTSYEYDAGNNPTKEGASTNTFNEGDELEKGTGVNYTYNEFGQRTKATPEKGSAITYGYDQVGDLTSVERPKEGEAAEIKDAYSYNGDGLRASQTVSGTTTHLAWDLAEKTPLLLSDGTNSYIDGPGNLPIEQIASGGTVLYMHHDQQGSTRLLTGSTGKSEATMTYDPYGNTVGTTGTAKTPLGYDAQYTSADTGLIYLRARAYDPKTAQFLSGDPVANITRAPYTYVNDNPLNGSDPTGLIATPCETTLEKIERAKRLEELHRLLERETEEMKEERRNRIIEEYEELTIAWGKGFLTGGACFKGSILAGVCEALVEPESAE
jgi:RHS repeat-associated protein